MQLKFPILSYILQKLHKTSGDSVSHNEAITSPAPANSILTNILVVDDDSMSRRVIVEFCKKIFNCNIFSAINAKEALAVLLKEKIDIVTIDIEMPEISGFELMEQMELEIPYDLDVWVVTAKDRYALDFVGLMIKSNSISKRGHCNYKGYFLKPVSFSQFMMISPNIKDDKTYMKKLLKEESRRQKQFNRDYLK